MSEYNIQFKFVSIYVVGKDGDLSVGAPYCRDCPNRTIQILDKNTRIKGPTLTAEEIKAFNRINKINSLDEFNNIYEKLFSVIKAKQLGKDADKELLDNLDLLNKRIIKDLDEQQKKDFESKWEKLHEIAEKGVHDFKIGTAGIKNK